MDICKKATRGPWRIGIVAAYEERDAAREEAESHKKSCADALQRSLEATQEILRLEAENERLAKAWEAKHETMVKAEEEAKFQFEQAQSALNREKQLREALEWIEWSVPGDAPGGHCPSCHAAKNKGHDTDCIVKQALEGVGNDD